MLTYQSALHVIVLVQLRLFHIFPVASAIAQVAAKAGKAYERDEGLENTFTNVLNMQH